MWPMDTPNAPSPTRWSALRGGPESAAAYRQQFLDRALAGEDLHGEARFVTELAPPPSRVLDAGCGFGRVASELTRLGHHVTGVDADPDLIALAREDVTTRFLVADLATLNLRTEQEFHVVLMAGNVVNYLPREAQDPADGTLAAVLGRLAAHLAPGGHLVAGFRPGPDVPEGGAPVDLRTYDRVADAVGLAYIARYATWQRQPFVPGGDYAVSVHRRRAD